MKKQVLSLESPGAGEFWTWGALGLVSPRLDLVFILYVYGHFAYVCIYTICMAYALGG